MSRQSLLSFIQAAKSCGASDDFIAKLLREQGWANRDIFKAFADHYQALTGLDVPPRRSKTERAKDAFYCLLGFVTLGTWTLALGSLFFKLIDNHFPDPLRPSGPFSFSQLADNIAAVIVAFPIYLVVTRLILRSLRDNPEGYDSPVWKWLTYLAMVITTGIVIGDLVSFLASFLRGDLTVRFVLKVGVVLVMAGGVLLYYLSSLRRTSSESNT